MTLQLFIFACALVSGVGASAVDELSQALSTISFAHAVPGTSKNGDAYMGVPLPCYYLEVENVTRFAGSWGGACAVQSMSSGPPPPSTCTGQGPPHAGFDRPGADITTVVAATPQDCSSACCDRSGCLAWVQVNSLQAGPQGACSKGGPCCWLKASVPAEAPDNYPGGIANGVVQRPPAPPIQVPPTGVRNAVPIGGLGAGTMELRGDGTFHEITIHSASPAGSAKYPTQGDMLLGVRAGSPGATRAVRTAAPAYAAPGVATITYSGTYPVSQLNISDPALAAAGLGGASLYAYHHLRPADSPTSSTPAIVLTLTASNTGSTPLPVSFFFTLPFGAMGNCERLGKGGVTLPLAAYADCLKACAANATGCGAWNFNGDAGTCTLLPVAGGMVFAGGQSWCGVGGAGWSTGGGDGSILTLSLNGTQPASAGSPAIGDVSLRAVGGSTLASASSFSLGVANDPAALFSAFTNAGAFAPGSNGGVTGGTFSGVPAAHGAVIVSATIPPGATVAQSIVLTWYFPNRDFYGANIGQFYSTLFSGSAEIATAYDAGRLQSIVGDVAAHTSVWAGAQTSHPSWLNDHMANQFSHFRNMIYSRDGLMREHEANDCPDLDSVHNDYQRHLPYLWAVPEFEQQKSELYQHCQTDAGMITENPGFHLGDRCGGRTMGDTTTTWLLEVLEIYQSTGNLTRLAEVWPAAVKGINWQIAVSKEYGIPAHLVCTYDILAMERYNSTTFNGVLHIAAMAAGKVLATVMKDTATFTAAEASRAAAVAAMTGPLMWNSTLGFFRAYTGGDAIMSDCLYGQQVALAHGLGWLLPTDMIAQHLAAEAHFNANPFGLTVVKGRKEPLVPNGGGGEEVVVAPDAIAQRKATRAREVRTLMQGLRARGDGQDDSVWMGSGPTWSCLALALGADGPAGTNVTAALEPSRWILSNYRDRLRMMWDLTGLSTTADWGGEDSNGQPFCTSHYGFMLTDYYLIYALSGQQTNIPAGKLSFAPLYAAPYTVPFALMGTEGTLAVSASGTKTLAVAFGSLTLPAGGLSVSGSAYPNSVSLTAGQSVSW